MTRVSPRARAQGGRSPVDRRSGRRTRRAPRPPSGQALRGSRTAGGAGGVGVPVTTSCEMLMDW